MSSARARSGGSAMRMTFRRGSRYSRHNPRSRRSLALAWLAHFAGTRLSRDEQRDTGAGKTANRAEHLLHGRRAAEELGNAWCGGSIAATNQPGVRRPFDQRDCLVDVERLRQVLERAA